MVVQWREESGELRAFIDQDGHEEEVTWAAQPGSQQALLECPVFEVLLEGNRGGGKTDALIMDFARYVGRGFGAEWRGILFRLTYKQLEDVVAKTKKWFPRIFPAATFNESHMRWTWPTGETLLLRYMDKPSDYDNYHGSSYTWIGFEELTRWPDDKCYKVMMSCCRSPIHDMPKKFRATTNPYGVGHNWVKARFQLPVPHGCVVGKVVKTPDEPDRVAIHSSLEENQILLHGDPDYMQRTAAAARNPSEKKAWVKGSWDIVAGGMFDDLWRPQHHVIPNIPFAMIPKAWKINRSYDHGQSAPFSVGWWAQSNGEPLYFAGRWIGDIPGDLIRIAEWYGWNGTSNEGLRMLSGDIAEGIRERERDWGIRATGGPADSSIFDDFEPGKSVAGAMKRKGVKWQAADKGRGSRKQGWEIMRTLLKQAMPGREGVREEPGLFICQRCDQFIRTFPVLPRCPKDMDDVDTKAEDHIADEARYRCREKIRAVAHSRSW